MRPMSMAAPDLRDWAPGKSVNPEVVLKFTEPVRGLNGSCLIASNIILIADCFANLIWRVDLPRNGGKATARVWLKHDSMAYDPDGPMPDCPGVNGVKYAPKTDYLYYTSTMKELFMRVRMIQIRTSPLASPNSSRAAGWLMTSALTKMPASRT
jgi:hypothetical protein